MGQTTKSLEAHELPEVKRVKTDHSNLHISRDEFEKKQQKQKEYDRLMEIESKKIKDRLAAEEAQAEEDLKKSLEEQTEETEVVTKPKNRKPKKPVEEEAQAEAGDEKTEGAEEEV